jgi:hypothetical protein
VVVVLYKIAQAGLSPVTGSALLVVAVMLNVFPWLVSRYRDRKRKETMRMNGDRVQDQVLTASTTVASGLLTNIAATAVVSS